MTTIAACLISSRNILLGDRTNAHVVPCLQEVLVHLDSIALLNIRKIIKYCVSEAIEQIEGGEFVSAGWILNLIHNLPLDNESEQSWDIDYFLSMELPVFLEHFDEIKSGRLIALCIFEHLAG